MASVTCVTLLLKENKHTHTHTNKYGQVARAEILLLYSLILPKGVLNIDIPTLLSIHMVLHLSSNKK